MKLSEFVTPDLMVARSVNLERDIHDESTLNRYLLTGKGLEIISRLTAGMNGEKISAWSLTGPYGMGKSSFVHFLLALCGPDHEKKTGIAQNLLLEKDTALHNQFQDVLAKRGIKGRGLFRVAATASFEPINRTLAKGLLMAVQRASEEPGADAGFGELAGDLTTLISDALIDSGRLLDLYNRAGRLSRSPVVVVIDELGKNLEYLGRYPAQGDLFILQSLAETGDKFLWVCLHQAFEEYSAGLTGRQRQEWGKIQGRFEDISFVEPRGQMLGFITDILVRRGKHPGLTQRVDQWADHFLSEAKQGEIAEVAQLDGDTLAGFYPLHPLAAAVLPELCIRFAQNDRTLFAFLCGGEPNALPSFLSSRTIDPSSDALPMFGLERLYDYFLNSTSAISMSRPGANRWLEIHTMIEGARDLPTADQNLLKMIGLLNLVSGPSGFRASKDRVAFAFSDPFATDPPIRITESLARLSEKGLLIYRRYADEYRLWEGTDFDIQAATEQRKDVLSTLPLDQVLEKSVPLMPLTASRHSYRTGTLRHFERRWLSADRLNAAPPACATENVDGLVLYAFGKEKMTFSVPEQTADGRPLLIAYSDSEDQIREMILDAAASRAVLEDSPELERDGVARREARFRANSAENRLRRFLSDLYSPGNPDVIWRSGKRNYELQTARHLSMLLSHLCDSIYFKCPIIRNELINRNKLSAAAARARRELIEAMLAGEAEPTLGMTGAGPEVAIYRSMFLAEGIHRSKPGGEWEFSPPDPKSSYCEAWMAIERALEDARDDLLSLPDLIRILTATPFGLKQGPIPVLICLYLLIHSDEVALYQEGAFIPYLSPEDLELMVKRPEYFELRKFSPLGIQGKVFRIYQELLNTSAVSVDRQMRNASMVNIVGPLVQFADGLSDYVKQTRSISREARHLLQTLLNAKDPIQLLFVELPKAVGVTAFEGDRTLSGDNIREFQVRLRNTIAELAQTYDRLIDKIKMVLQEVFQKTGDLKLLREDLKLRAEPMVKRCSDMRLKPLVAALSRNRGGDAEWLASIATIASQRPVDSWRDSDLPAFSTQMHDLARRFLALERLVSEERRRLPDGGAEKEARLISLARPDGSMASEILWLDKTRKKSDQKAMERILEGRDEEELKTLLVMLSEHLFKDHRSDNND